MLDPRLAGHALEQQRFVTVVAKKRTCEATKRIMNVMGRHRCRDAIKCILFAKDNSPSEIAALPPRWISHHTRKNTGRL